MTNILDLFNLRLEYRTDLYIETVFKDDQGR